jgi:hypothetical protein
MFLACVYVLYSFKGVISLVKNLGLRELNERELDRTTDDIGYHPILNFIENGKAARK